MYTVEKASWWDHDMIGYNVMTQHEFVLLNITH
jgi:hypothetical protein